MSVLVLVLVGLSAVTSRSSSALSPKAYRLLSGSYTQACSVLGGAAHCFAKVVADKTGKPAVVSSPVGYGPAQFHSAYQLPVTSSKPGTIAVVDAYDDPAIVSD